MEVFGRLRVLVDTGTERRGLTHARAADIVAGWSQDGTKLVFTSDRSGSPDVWVVDADGMHARPLLRRPGSQAA